MTKDVHSVQDLLDVLNGLDKDMSLNMGDGYEVSVCLTPQFGKGTKTLIIDTLWPEDEDDD